MHVHVRVRRWGLTCISLCAGVVVWFAPPGDEETTEFFVSLLEAVADGDEEMVMDAKIGLGGDDANAEWRDRSGASIDGATYGPGAEGAVDEAAGDVLDAVGAESDTGARDVARGASFEAATVPELKAELRRRGLPAQGRKAELLDRLRGDVLPASSGLWKADGAVGSVAGRSNGAEGGGSGPLAAERQSRIERVAAAQDQAEDPSETKLQQSVVGYLAGQPGCQASSRDVGRHLAAQGLLATLKERHAGLFHFLQRNSQLFEVVLPEERGALEYKVHLTAEHGRADGDGPDAATGLTGTAATSSASGPRDRVREARAAAQHT